MICPYCKNEIQPVEENTSEVSVVKDGKGHIQLWTEITRDAKGKQIQRRADGYSYYPSGEIDTIVQEVYDADDQLISEQHVKHYMNGRSPEIARRSSK